MAHAVRAELENGNTGEETAKESSSVWAKEDAISWYVRTLQSLCLFESDFVAHNSYYAFLAWLPIAFSSFLKIQSTDDSSNLHPQESLHSLLRQVIPVNVTNVMGK